MIDPDQLQALQAGQHDHPADVSAQAHVEAPVQSTQQLWNAATQDDYAKVALEAAAELRRGDAIHGRGIVWPANSVSHEAYGVLLEEVDELWDEMKRKVINRAAMRKEAIQVAAMAIRFVMNVCDTNSVVVRAAPNREPWKEYADEEGY